MMDVSKLAIVKQVAGLLATDNDATVADQIISVSLLVLISTAVAPVLGAVFTVVPDFALLPVTAGILNAVANKLS